MTRKPTLRRALTRTILIATVGTVVLLAGALLGSSAYMLHYAIGPDPNRRDLDSAYSLLYERVPDMRPWVDSLQNCGQWRDTFITADDGRRLHAIWIEADSARGRTAVVVHGWRDCAVTYSFIGRMYHRDLGMNVLLPDLHAHGLSDGEAIGMGWHDRLDLARWVEVAAEKSADSAHQAAIAVHGVSMGAATTMCLAGDSVSEAVKCYVADCGYTSAWDVFEWQIGEQFGLPAFPLMHIADRLCGLKYGWHFRDASPLKQISKCHKPMLIIHGGADDFVPTAMAYELYDAKPAPRELWIAAEAPHACSYALHTAEYTRRVERFVEREMDGDGVKN